MKKIFLGFTFLVFTLSCAQAQSWQWGRRGGGAAGLSNFAEKIVDMATDAKGNVYILARLDGSGNENIETGNGDTLDIGGKTMGHESSLLASYDCNGKLRWAKSFWCETNNQTLGMSMDTLGHINVLALLGGNNIHIDNDLTISRTSSKSRFFQVIQYDTAGVFKWFNEPTPDTVVKTRANKYIPFTLTTTPNGETYVYCTLGKGLIKGSNNLVVNTEGMHMLKYSVTGVPTELIKLDMNMFWQIGVTVDDLDAVKFSVTKSKKIIFTGVPYQLSNGVYPVTVGGQVLKRKIFLCCFSPTGSVLWKVENTDTTSGGISGRPLLDESKGLIYVCGYASSNGTTDNDTIQNFVIKNNYSFSFKLGVPLIMSLDTLGIVKMVKNGYSYSLNGSSVLSDLAFRKDGRLFAAGLGGALLWDAFVFDNGNSLGYQTFMPSFNATTGLVMSMDSLMGASATYGELLTADRDNNIYLGGHFNSDIVIAVQTLQSAGGISDFYLAKYGYANCSGAVPLKMLSFTAMYQPTPNPSKQGNVLLQWQTANEVSVSHFNIQRSLNGRDFVNIGKVSANNKSYNEYQFIDDGQQSTVDGGLSTIYYRIESVDKDGYKDYSEIKSVDRRPSTVFSVYPNPARDVVNVVSKQLIKNIMIANLYGANLLEYSSINNNNYQIGLSSLASGIYWLIVTLKDGSIQTQKIIIEK